MSETRLLAHCREQHYPSTCPLPRGTIVDHPLIISSHPIPAIPCIFCEHCRTGSRILAGEGQKPSHASHSGTAFGGFGCGSWLLFLGGCCAPCATSPRWMALSISVCHRKLQLVIGSSRERSLGRNTPFSFSILTEN